MSIFALLGLLPSLTAAGPFTYVAGRVRIQILSPSLVRVEQEGPRGFEDRPTFTVVNRNFARTEAAVKESTGRVVIHTVGFDVTMPRKSTSIADVSITDPAGKSLFDPSDRVSRRTFLPPPSDVPPSWVINDSPRLIPPAWGATPAPASVDPALAATSGWDARNDAPDIYIFIPGKGGYNQLRKDFLALTGPVPKPPLYILGFIDSRWFPYTEQEALASIDTYRQKGIPMDTFVVDTDWRINGSAGYDVEPKDFPDMPRFIQEAHDRHAHLMFNDHPDPKAASATDPKELAFRWQGLSKLLNWGMDVWWYDRNWSTSLHEPMPGIRKEAWGQRLYHDMTERARSSERPWIMSNAEGIDNGIAHYAPDVAGHRFPMWWTGDTGSRFEYLKRGVQNGVDRGIMALQPYTHEDLGGHTGPTPSPELYVRYLEFGCLSPITRVHCTRGQDRHPWAFGPEAEAIVTDYIKLRYRLLPTLYSAAQRATDDGTPMLRRCDLNWPQFPEAAQDDQYLLGDDILVAPIVASVSGELKPIPTEMVHTPDGKPGLRAEYFDNANLEGEPKLVRTDAKIDFNWSGAGPVAGVGQDNFSVRWTGNLGPVPLTGKYRIVTRNDDGVRVYVDGRRIVDDWKPEDSATNDVAITFEAGSTHTLRVEYMQLTGNALCTVGWLPPSTNQDNLSHRSVWIPPGVWQDLWTGDTVEGPTTISVGAALNQTPMWVARGGIVLTGPDMQYTGEKPMDPITADVYLGGNADTKRELDEDDGISTAYIKGALARTQVELKSESSQATLRLGATKGNYPGIRPQRKWIVRFHLPKALTAGDVLVDGKPVRPRLEARGSVQIPFRSGAARDEGGVLTISLPPTSIRQEHLVQIALHR